MSTDRIMAFSDGVLAIIITIMALELKAPHGADLATLAQQWPIFAAYVLSFIYVGIYWNNHHHLFFSVEKVNGAVLWANMNLLFWLSLLPVATAWMSDNHFATLPLAVYGCVLLAAAFAYLLLVIALLRAQGGGSVLADAVGKDVKGKISIVLYLAGIVGSFFSPWLGAGFYIVVALMWLVPDRRIEERLTN